VILTRYVGRRVVVVFFGVLAAALVVVLGIDFADRAHIYVGEGWASAVGSLYACRAAVMGYQLAPAVLLVAVELAVASLKRRGEVTAMRALGISPARVILPCLAVGFCLAVSLFAANESIVGRAARRVDEIMAERFFIHGDWETWYGQRRWFRSGRTVYFLRDADVDGSYRDASIFELTPDFRLKSRVDAESLRPLANGRWQAERGTIRRFDGDAESQVDSFDARELALDEPARSFSVRTGRPDSLRFLELRQEIRERREVGLKETPYVVALHAKVTHPLMAIPLALVGAALSLRPRRRDAAAVAMVEGLGAVAVIWAATVVFRAAAVGGRFAPWLGPWLVLAIAMVAAAVFAKRAVSQ
jgi:lipopolysaccharide export system permease protein